MPALSERRSHPIIIPGRQVVPVVALLLLAGFALAAAQARPRSDSRPPTVVAEAYRSAAEFLPGNVQKRVRIVEINPRWTGEGDRFWYERQVAGQTDAVLIDPARNTRTDGFDRSKLPAAPKAGAPDEVLSPDGAWAAFVKDYNLWVRSVATGQEVQLTADGVRDFAYGGRGEAWQGAATSRRLQRKLPPVLVWSPDSKRLVAQHVDQRGVQELYMIESVPREGNRPRLFSYRMPFSGDAKVPLAHLIIFDVAARRAIPVQADPLYVLHVSPIDFRYVWWSDDATKLYFVREERGAKALTLFEVDPATGAARRMVEESSPTYADLYLDIYNKQPTVRILGGGAEVLWYSERDGWAHLYLYDGRTGALERQLTRGEFVVRDVLHVDEAKRQIYFTAGGREPGRNPYYRHLYRMSLDGSEPTLLTPENADHQITFTPSGQYFIDRWSRADTVPTFVLRKSDGTLLRTLEVGDVSELMTAGWRWPELFRAKARDGKTDVYGLIYRPTSFDPGKQYPIIDDIYPGPQTLRSSVSFPTTAGLDPYWYWTPQSVAQVGFIVVTVDGMGTPWRSKKFHDVSYRNLGDAGGLDDHISAIRELAGRYPYMDTSRVGIYGGSSGGYATLRAMLTRPDFFKVGVSAVPYIGPTAIVAWWSDRYQGFPVDTANYHQSDLVPLAGNLRGKLLVALGGLDENADPFLVMPLLDAFVKANKDFDLLLLPSADHGGVGGSPYFIRKRWDYFVRHLLGAEPPNPNRADATPE